MCLGSSISKRTLSEAIRCYKTYGVVTQRTTQLGRSLFRKLGAEMTHAGCSDIENAMEAEVVLGERDEYFEMYYDPELFDTEDDAKHYVITHNL